MIINIHVNVSNATFETIEKAIMAYAELCNKIEKNHPGVMANIEVNAN